MFRGNECDVPKILRGYDWWRKFCEAKRVRAGRAAGAEPRGQRAVAVAYRVERFCESLGPDERVVVVAFDMVASAYAWADGLKRCRYGAGAGRSSERWGWRRDALRKRI